jgi:tetratricopeptide (TPR) repeat protein
MRAQRFAAKACILSGDDPNAQAGIDRLLALYGGKAGIAREVMELADDYMKVEQFEKALSFYQMAVGRWPGDEGAMEAQMKLAFAYIKLGRMDEADAATEKLIGEFYEDEKVAEAVHEVVERYRNAGENERAKRLYQQILEKWPYSEPALMEFQVGIALSGIKLEDEEGADAAVDTLILDYNDNNSINVAKGLFQIAEQHYYAEDYLRAIELLEVILTDYPDSNFPARGEVPYVLATCYRHLGEYEAAIALYEQVAAEQPGSKLAPIAQYRVMRCWREARKAGRVEMEESIEQMRRACKKLVTEYPDSHMAKLAIELMGGPRHVGFLYEGEEK